MNFMGRYSINCQRAFSDALVFCEQNQQIFLEIEHVCYALVKKHIEIPHKKEFLERLQIYFDQKKTSLSEPVRIGPKLDQALDEIETSHTRTISELELWNHLSQCSQIILSLKKNQVLKSSKDQEKTMESSTPDKKIFSKYTLNMVEEAKHKTILMHRHDELNLLIETLERRTKNNPVLVGEAGVGKTSLVERLAQEILRGQVPLRLQKCQLLKLDLGLLISGARYRGDFEERLTEILKDIEKSDHRFILFIDEIHTIVGAGNLEGNLDVANLMKPYLTNPKIQILGATTPKEYRKSFIKDSALERRFQKIELGETTPDETFEILQYFKKDLESFHKMTIEEPSLKMIMEVSKRHLPYRKFPDKAVDLLDQIASYQKHTMKDSHLDAPKTLSAASQKLQIPLSDLTETESQKIMRLERFFKSKIAGQKPVLNQLIQKLRIQRLGLLDPNKPEGIFMFTGPSGVGKTLTAQIISEVFYLKKMLRLDMSEFMHDHHISRLIGAPAGYIGHGSGGQLTEWLRVNPFSIILLDEIEKAHPKVWDLFLQVFDSGTLTDSEGVMFDCRRSFFIMTSNVVSSNPINEFQKIGMRVEFLNRIDDILVFDTLNHEGLKNIVQHELTKLNQRLEKYRLEIELSTNLTQHLIHEALSKTHGGARALKKIFLERVTDLLTQQILNGHLKNHQKWQLDIDLNTKDQMFRQIPLTAA